MTDAKLTMHPNTPDWAKPMWNLLALVHQGNIDASREAEAVRVRVWHAENEIQALLERVSILERRDTMPSPPIEDDTPTQPGE